MAFNLFGWGGPSDPKRPERIKVGRRLEENLRRQAAAYNTGVEADADATMTDRNAKVYLIDFRVPAGRYPAYVLVDMESTGKELYAYFGNRKDPSFTMPKDREKEFFDIVMDRLSECVQASRQRVA